MKDSVCRKQSVLLFCCNLVIVFLEYKAYNLQSMQGTGSEMCLCVCGWDRATVKQFKAEYELEFKQFFHF